MGLSIRTSSTTAGGAANSTSLGGRPSASGISGTTGAFVHNISSTENDNGHTDYRCVFIYNNGTTVMSNVKITPSNRGGGSTVTVAASSVATNTFASYATAVIGSETTAPAISGSYGSSVNLGTLNAGEVKAVWLKRVTTAKVAASSGDTCDFVVSADEAVAE